MPNADRLIEVFNEANARPAGPDRERFLAEACQGDPELKEQVISLLQAHAGAGDFLKGGPVLPLTAPQHTTIRYFGDYELLEEIARGGMGVVFKARQASLQRTVALKMILAGKLASPASVRRFHTEAEAAANLKHPNIVAIHEVGEHEGQQYYSMDYIEGQDLAARVRQGPVPLQWAAHCVQTMAGAIHYAHLRGVLHRDLKPSNILLDAQGPYITDFGLARLVERESSLTQAEAILGTPSYMAPEQAAGDVKQLTTAADIYSLGAMLYELLTGRPPFVGATVMETLQKVMNEEPVAPWIVRRDAAQRNPKAEARNPKEVRGPKSECTSDMPALRTSDVDIICLKCLEKDPSRRYGSAEALAEDLGRWLRREPILARPTGLLEKTVKWGRRNPSTAALAALVVALLGAGAFAFGSHYWQLSQRERTARLKTAQQEHDRQICHENLRYLRRATLSFQQASNRWPDSLAELVPAFIVDTNRLRCPLSRLGTPLARTFESSGSLYFSYVYEFTTEPAPAGKAHHDDVPLWQPDMSIRDLRQAQIARYGAIVPLIRCGHHYPCPAISHDGQVYETWVGWTYEVAGRANADQRLPPGWFEQGAPVGRHRASIDLEAAHRGRACVRLDLQRSTSGSVSLGQILRAEPFRDHWLKFSAWIAADSVSYADLRVSLRDRNNGILPVNDSQPRCSLKNTVRWQQYEFTTYVPPEAESLALSVLLLGYGRLWVDDVALHVEDRPVAARTNLAEINTPFHSGVPANLDFELLTPKFAALASARGRVPPAPNSVPVTPPGWFTDLGSSRGEVTVDSATARHGQASACLHLLEVGTNRLRQRLQAEPFQRSRFKVTAWLKQEHPGEEGVIRLTVLDRRQEILLSEESPSLPANSTDWTPVDVSAEIPVTAQSIELTCRHAGAGKLWVDDFHAEYSREGVSRPVSANTLANADFEE